MRTNLLRLLALCAMIILSGCEKEATLPETEEVEEEAITFNDIAGVYEALSNDLLFISISEYGYVSYCLNEYVMGHGNATLLDNETLSIPNTYTGYADKLTFWMSGDTLNIKGDITERNSDDIIQIMLTMQKVEESQIYSFAGKTWRGLTSLGSKYTEYQLFFTSDNIATFVRTDTDTGIIKWQYLWYYIPRIHHERGNIIYTDEGSSASKVYCLNGVYSTNLFYSSN